MAKKKSASKEWAQKTIELFDGVSVAIGRPEREAIMDFLVAAKSRLPSTEAIERDHKRKRIRAKKPAA